MRFGWLVLISTVVLCGCIGRRTLYTDSRFTMTGPLKAEVVADMQPRAKQEPLRQMTVEGHAGAGGSAKVALVDVDGLMLNVNLTGPYSAGENPVALFREKLDSAAADPCVRAVVVRINSPGGGVTATDIMRRELERFRQRTGLPVVACLMDVGTGGAYCLATAADAIYAHPTTVTGGLGVILNLYNLQDAMAQFNVLGQPVKAGENIDMGSVTRPLSDQQRAWLEQMAAEFQERFLRMVAESRPGAAIGAPELRSGRVFTAQQAQRLGLLDEIGYLDDAIRAAQQRAGVPNCRVVMFHRPGDPARTPFATTANRPSLGDVVPLSVPGLERNRLPVFLCAWLPDPTIDRVASP